MNQRLERRKRNTGDDSSNTGGTGNKKSGFRGASGRGQTGASRGGASYSESRSSQPVSLAARKTSPKHKTSETIGNAPDLLPRLIITNRIHFTLALTARG